MSHIYVTGHRNPDTDSIASAIAYAELRSRLDPDNTYIPVRLGKINAQTRWVLDKAGVPDPEVLTHIMLRVQDAMSREVLTATIDNSVRQVGLMMARERISVVPVLDHEGHLAGVVTERALARRYIRESREASSLVDTPTSVAAIAEALGGELLEIGTETHVAGRVWVMATDTASSGIQAGDVVIMGNRPEAQRFAIDAGISVLVISNGVEIADDMREHARAQGITVIRSPLDSYVSGRMVTLAAPCQSVMDSQPLTVRPDDLLADVTELVKDVHYRAAVAVDRERRPVGLVTRSDVVNPARRRVILVDHAEESQSVQGVSQAEIVEILDHHHIGSIETHVPVRATFDPVGSTATLVLERFQQEQLAPTPSTALLLLSAILSDTVILNSPTTTRRDTSAVAHLERVLDLDHARHGREMFEAGSDLSQATAAEILTRDAKDYDVDGGSVSIAQIETVGQTLVDRTDELLAALRERQAGNGHALSALMITDILGKATTLLVAGDVGTVERALGEGASTGIVDLPGVMSRKKQVAPMLLGAF